MKNLGIIQRIGVPRSIPQDSEEDESEEIQRYNVSYYRSEYVSVIVDATNEDDAINQANDIVYYLPNSAWVSSDDIEFSDCETEDTEDYELTEDPR